MLDRLYVATHAQERGAESRFLDALRGRLYVLVAQEMRRARFFLTAADVDDLVQDLLIDAWRVDLVRYDPRRGSLLAFLRRKVRWRLIEMVRRVARNHARRAPVRDVPERVDPESTLRARAVHDEKEAMKEEALRALPNLDDRARDTIVRHDLKGEALKDVARDLALHPSSVTRLRQKGLRELRAVLDGGYRAQRCSPRSPSSSRQRPPRTRKS